MIFFHIPFDPTKNIGKYYNRAMEKVCEDDWCCFVDGDAMFTSAYFGLHLQAVIDENPSYGLLYATTNRIGCLWQQAGASWSNNDFEYHRSVGNARWVKFGTQVEDVTNREEGGSGFFILLSKDVWRQCGGFSEAGMLGVDWDFFQRAKRSGTPIGIALGIYLFHWYRGGNSNDTSHLA